MSWISENIGIGLPALLIIVGALFGAVGAVLYYRQTDRLQKVILEKTEKNAALNREIAELNRKIAATVTGGESFCYLFPSPSFGELNTIDFHLHHKGEYPVYDVSIRVWDESCLKRIDHGEIFEKHLGYRKRVVTHEEWLKMQENSEFIIKTKEIEKEIKERMRSCLILQEGLGTFTSETSTNIMEPPLVSCTVPRGMDLSQFSQEYSVNIVARNGKYNQGREQCKEHLFRF